MTLLGTRRNSSYEAGMQHFDHGQYEMAIARFRDVLACESGALPGERKLAEFYLGEAYGALAEVHVQQQSWSSAEESLRHALEIHPEYADLHYSLAKVCYMTARPADAEKHLVMALEINTGYARAAFLQGLVRYSNGDRDEGLARMREAAAMDQSFRLGDMQRGLNMHQAGDYAGATDAFARLCEMQMDRVGDLTREAKEALRSGDLVTAEKAVREALCTNPDYPDLHNLMGLVWLAREECLPAVNEFKCAILINPRFVAALVNLGKACRKMGNEDAALAAFKKAEALEPCNEDIQELLANR